MPPYSSITGLCVETPAVILAGGRGTRLLPYMGRPDDYKQANEDFPAMEAEFLRTYVESASV